MTRLTQNQEVVLAYLRKAGWASTATIVANVLPGMDLGAATRVLTTLEQRGLVRRERRSWGPDAYDRWTLMR